MNEETKIPLLVMGIGNYLMGDEGVGIHLIHFLEKENLPEKVQLLDGGVGGFHLLEFMQMAKQIIIIDASNDGKPIGTISKLYPRFSSDYPKTLTAHDIGLKDLLDAFYLSGKELPDILLITVSIDALPKMTTVQLSEEIQSILPTLLEEVKKEINIRLLKILPN